MSAPRRHTRGMGLALALALVFVWLPRAQAHPFGAQFYSHQLLLSLERQRICVELTAEVPTSVVMQEFFEALGGAEPDEAADARYMASKLEELRGGLQLVLDGQELQLEDKTASDVKNGVGNSNFFTYKITLVAPWTPQVGERHVVEVLNRNRTGGAAYYRNDVLTDDSIKVITSNHWEALTDPAVQATQGWSRDSGQRDLRVQLKVLEVVPAQTVLSPEGAAPEDAPQELPLRALLGALGGAALVGGWFALRRVLRGN